MIPITILDNFFETPTLVREFALRQNFYKGDRGNWPGKRTDYIDEICPELFHNIASKLIIRIPGARSFELLQTTFQYIPGIYGDGWVHDDDKDHNVAGLIYLNPDPTPINSGTTFYDHRLDVNGEMYSEMFREEVNSEDPEVTNKYAKYRREHKDQWVPNTVVQNRFNRCVMFNPRTWHSADNYFGNDLYDSRLTIVFFGRAV